MMRRFCSVTPFTTQCDQSIPLTPLSVPGPDDVLSAHKVVTSVTFLTTLLGRLTAFVLGRFGQWRSMLNERRAVGNLAIVTIAEMYSERLSTTLSSWPESKRTARSCDES